jgi:hypothetical protein
VIGPVEIGNVVGEAVGAGMVISPAHTGTLTTEARGVRVFDWCAI